MTDQTKAKMVEIPTYDEASAAMGACKASHLEHFLFSLDENLAEDENRDVWREFLADVLTEQVAHREAAAAAAALRMAADEFKSRARSCRDLGTMAAATIGARQLDNAAEIILALITPEASSALAAFEARVREEARQLGIEQAEKLARSVSGDDYAGLDRATKEISDLRAQLADAHAEISTLRKLLRDLVAHTGHASRRAPSPWHAARAYLNPSPVKDAKT